jgi:hypothetical protein
MRHTFHLWTLALGLFLGLSTLNSRLSTAHAAIVLTNNTVFVKHYDSLDVEQYANRRTSYDEAAWEGMYPQFFL